MLHHRVLDDTSEAAADRRQSERSSPGSELVFAWHDDPCTTRHELVDLSKSGCRIRSAAPLLQGRTGTAIRRLPEGTKLNQAVMVVWSRLDESSGCYEIGLRFFEPQG